MPPKNGTQISVKIDGKARTLRYKARAWEAFQKVTGRNVLKADALKDLELPDIVSLVWVGLLHEDPELSRDTVSDALGVGDLITLQPTIMTAIQADMPEPKGEGEKKGSKKTTSP